MLYRIGPTIVHGECWLSKLVRESSRFYSTCKGWLGNLIQHPAHVVILQAFMRCALTSAPVIVILITRERLAGGSHWCRPITAVSIIFRRRIRIWGSPSLPLTTQLPAKAVNFQLHAFSILLMRDVTLTLRLAFASMCGMHTNLPVHSLFKVEEVVLTLRTNRLLLVWPRTYHSWKLISLKLKFSHRRRQL